MTTASQPPAPPASWWTPANVLTGSRLAAAPLCALAIVRGATSTAAALFLLAVLTDLVDGRVARRRGESSARGALFDHATDATFVTLGLGAIAFRSAEIPWLLPLLVALAFAQYVTDSRAHAGRHLRASFLGRWNGIAYFVLLGIPVVRDAFGLNWPAASIVSFLGWILVASTIASGVDRLSASRATPAG